MSVGQRRAPWKTPALILWVSGEIVDRSFESANCIRKMRTINMYGSVNTSADTVNTKVWRLKVNTFRTIAC